jgi:Ras-related protein Rab-5C
MYYRGASAAVVVFDITHAASFERAKKWVGELRQNVANPSLVIALVGNKADLAEQRTVPEADAREYAAEAGLLYFESSAKDNLNVTELFVAIAERLPRREAAQAPAGGIALGETPAGGTTGARKSSCCGT